MRARQYLYRTNSQSRLFEEGDAALRVENTMLSAFFVLRTRRDQDMISYLKVILNPDDSVSLLRVINTPARGIGKTNQSRPSNDWRWRTGLSLCGVAIGESASAREIASRAGAERHENRFGS